jgi:hypothetical protein
VQKVQRYLLWPHLKHVLEQLVRNFCFQYQNIGGSIKLDLSPATIWYLNPEQSQARVLDHHGHEEKESDGNKQWIKYLSSPAVHAGCENGFGREPARTYDANSRPKTPNHWLTELMTPRYKSSGFSTDWDAIAIFFVRNSCLVPSFSVLKIYTYIQNL